MARPCKTCAHPLRDAIDALLVRPDRPSFRNMAARYGLSTTSVYEHYAEHLPERLVRAQSLREQIASDDLLAQARTLQEQAFVILSDASARVARPDGSRGPMSDPKLALKALAACRNNVRLLGEVLGKLQPQGGGGTTTVLVVKQYVLADNGRRRVYVQPDTELIPQNGRRTRARLPRAG